MMSPLLRPGRRRAGPAASIAHHQPSPDARYCERQQNGDDGGQAGEDHSLLPSATQGSCPPLASCSPRVPASQIYTGSQKPAIFFWFSQIIFEDGRRSSVSGCAPLSSAGLLSSLTDVRPSPGMSRQPPPGSQGPSKDGCDAGTDLPYRPPRRAAGRICVPSQRHAVRYRYTAYREAASSGRAGRTSLGERAGFHGSDVVASELRPPRSERDSL